MSKTEQLSLLHEKKAEQLRLPLGTKERQPSRKLKLSVNVNGEEKTLAQVLESYKGQGLYLRASNGELIPLD